MDTPTRTLCKAITWQISGLIMMTLIGYIAIGSFTAAGGIAVAGTVVGAVAFILHERLWNRVSWGRKL
ncbi:MAG: DUF2061 domain-containing protein [Pseudomonadota bacterium]